MLIIAYWFLLVPICNFTLIQVWKYKPEIQNQVIKKQVSKSAAVPVPTKIPTKTPIPISTVKPTIKPKPKETIKYDSHKGKLFKVSAYDLSLQSCSKPRTSRYFGITRSGFSLRNQTRASAMTIAADLRIFKIGTKVYMSFTNKKFAHMSGIYTVRDTGSGVRGNKLDLFFGDFHSSKPAKAAMNFGVQKAYVKKVK
jgi:3D (Asp-Asp-Asp) domain-containing protein